MNKELASALKGKLLTLPFAHEVAGLVQTLTTEVYDSENQKLPDARRPVAYDVYLVGAADPCTTAETAMMPSSQRKSIIYFEDFGIQATDTLRGGMQGFNSSLRLICWLDRSKLVGSPYAEIAGRCQAAIIDRLTTKQGPENLGMFKRLQVSVARIPPQDAMLFGRYTYYEPDRQYLRPPFEFFGIDLSCKFYVSNKCLSEIPWNISVCS